MKKIILVFVVLMLFTICMPGIAAASSVNKKDDIKILYLSSEEISKNYEGLSFSKSSFIEFKNKNIEDITSYDIILLPQNKYKEASKEKLLEAVNNGSVVMIYGKDLLINDIQLYMLGEVREKAEDFSHGLGNKYGLAYFFKINNSLEFGGVIDASELKLKNIATGEYVAAKDIIVKDKDGKDIKSLPFDAIDNINYSYSYLKEISKELINGIADNSKVNTLMPPGNYSYVRGTTWTNLGSNFGRMIGTVYFYRYAQDTTHLWDCVTRLRVDSYSDFKMRYMKTKSYANYINQDIIDWEALPNNNSSFTISIGLSPGLSYTSSTTGVGVSETSGTDWVEWYGDAGSIGNPDLVTIEPVCRVTNTYNNFVFRRYMGTQIIQGNNNIPVYETPYLSELMSFPDF